MPRHHTIISGTGRAGTTFLVQLLTALKLETGFDDPSSDIYPNCNAGMERDLRAPDAPYIVKSPWLCDYLGELLLGNQVVIDHAIVPVRDLYAAAESRRSVSSKNTDPAIRLDDVPGGLWHTTVPENQEHILTEQLYKLLSVLARYDIPLTLLHFPRLVMDPEYLYGKMGFLLGEVGFEKFRQAFNDIAAPQLVHDFNVK